jgi:hypothetical protein
LEGKEIQILKVVIQYSTIKLLLAVVRAVDLEEPEDWQVEQVDLEEAEQVIQEEALQE